MNSFAQYSLFVLLFVACSCFNVCSADSDNLQDVCPAAPPQNQTIFINGLPCKNPANVTAQDFITRELIKRGSFNIFGSSMKIVTASGFAGLNTLGLSIGRTDLEVDGFVAFHYHPRATEMIFVNQGVIRVGFRDTQNQFFQTTLKVGDVFVFPKGLSHYILNQDFKTATVYSVFNCQNPGLASFAVLSDNTLESLDSLKRKLISLSASEVTDLSLPGLESIYS